MRHPDSENTVRVYVKGAPEYIVNKCTSTLGADGRRAALDDGELNHILSDVLFNEFTSKGLRSIAFAYRDLTEDEFNDLRQECNNF